MTGLLIVLGGLATLDGSKPSVPRPAAQTSTSPAPRAPLPTVTPDATRPNIVFVLTDDLSLDLVKYMPHVSAMAQAGTSFADYSVTDSLCCPSRSSILTGKFPHNTHVFTNTEPDGGMRLFRRYGGEHATFGYALQRAGYRTALMGKYLNGYEVGRGTEGLPSNYVPPGWTDWVGGAGAYRNFDYDLNENGKIVHYGSAPEDYLTRVITRHGQRFIESSAKAKTPFLLELATYTPHAPYTPDPRDAGSFRGLTAPRVASFGRHPSNAPPWLARIGKLTPQYIRFIDHAFRLRVEAVQSVDRAIGELETTLRRTGQLANTYFVFNSDNGYHLGQHGLREGKKTAFDTDVHVPLVVVGPGVSADRVDSHVVQNIDLAPTFMQIAGATIPGSVDGRSLLPLLQGEHAPWRTIAAVEHHGPRHGPPVPGDAKDPDTQPRGAGNPPNYVSLRGRTWTYVQYADGVQEYYDRARDPAENANVVGRVSFARLTQLARTVRAISSCHGSVQCWRAARPTSR